MSISTWVPVIAGAITATGGLTTAMVKMIKIMVGILNLIPKHEKVIADMQAIAQRLARVEAVTTRLERAEQKITAAAPDAPTST